MAGIHNVLAGASSGFSFTISTNQTNLNLRTAAIAAGWNEQLPITAEIQSGVYISSNNTSVPAITVSGSFPGGVFLVNRGFIFGMGGAGGNGGRLDAGPTFIVPTAGGSGGLALSVSSALQLDNSAGVIGGGGGGGGGGGAGYQSATKDSDSVNYSGSGGGGGITGSSNSSGGLGNSVGSYAAVVKQAGTNGASGTISNRGLGGTGGIDGGNGGTRGAAGSAGGGTSGLSPRTSSAAGGSGGGAISGNSFITYIGSTGTRLGSIT